MPDGRLLVSHAFIGAVSIYDTTSLPPKLIKLITLATSQNPDETVSQGVPRSSTASPSARTASRRGCRTNCGISIIHSSSSRPSFPRYP
ncbi:MAG: hypothetical protein WDM84_09675 [Bauldia sp.]